MASPSRKVSINGNRTPRANKCPGWYGLQRLRAARVVADFGQSRPGFEAFTGFLRLGDFLRIRRPPDLLDSEAKTPQQQHPQNRAFRVSDTHRDLVDAR